MLKEWSECWHQGKTEWHEQEVNSNLKKYFIQLRSIKNETDKFTVLVPLCGKSLDIMWLLEQGCTVVGVEGVEEGVKELFEQHSLTYSIIPLQNEDLLFKSKQLPLEVYCCNIFDYPKYTTEKFDLIWDRGSFIAIDYEYRKKYASVMKNLYAPNFYHLLETFDHESEYPRVLPLDEVKELLGPEYNYEQLEKIECKDEFSKRFKMDLKFFFVNIFLISQERLT